MRLCSHKIANVVGWIVDTLFNQSTASESMLCCSNIKYNKLSRKAQKTAEHVYTHICSKKFSASYQQLEQQTRTQLSTEKNALGILQPHLPITTSAVFRAFSNRNYSATNKKYIMLDCKGKGGK